MEQKFQTALVQYGNEGLHAAGHIIVSKDTITYIGSKWANLGSKMNITIPIDHITSYSSRSSDTIGGIELVIEADGTIFAFEMFKSAYNKIVAVLDAVNGNNAGGTGSSGCLGVCLTIVALLTLSFLYLI